MSSVTAERPRDFVRVEGPQAADYLNRMVSNDMLSLEVGDVCDALLLTAKARVVATLRVMRRGPDDFLLLTEPGLGDVVRDQLLRARFAARCAIETEVHTSTLVLGEGAAPPPGAIAIPTADYGLPGWRFSTAASRRRSAPTSSSACGSRPGRRLPGRTSTTACSPPKPA